MLLDTASLEHQLQLYKGLVEVSSLINEITKSEDLLPAILDVARRVLHAEAASLLLMKGNGDLQLVAARGGVSSTLLPAIVVPRGQGISGWVLEHSTPVLVEDAQNDPRFFSQVDKLSGYRTRSMVCVPLSRHERKIGVLQIMNPQGRESFNESDVEATCAYASLAATALDKLQTLEMQREQERVEREYRFAHEIQMSFLPAVLPERPDLCFAAAYRPAQTVGGDFYDVVEMGPDEFYFVIGDVSGKGVPAALLMAQALSTLRLIIRPGISPDDALARWNSRLSGHTIRGMFITALLGRLTPSTRRVEMSTAGHCAPFRLSQARAEEVFWRGAPPLGILPELPANLQETTLLPGEVLLFFTDGLVESFNADEVPLDRSGVRALLQESSLQGAQEVVDHLLEGERQHRREALPHDDLTLLVLGFR